MSKEDKARMWRIAARYSAVGIEMATSVFIGAWCGTRLDAKLGTQPYLQWFGFVVGIGAAGLAVKRVIAMARAA